MPISKQRTRRAVARIVNAVAAVERASESPAQATPVNQCDQCAAARKTLYGVEGKFLCVSCVPRSWHLKPLELVQYAFVGNVDIAAARGRLAQQ